MFAVVYDCWGSLLWRADDALLYLRRLHTFGCGVNRRRWLVRSYGSSHGNYIRLTGPQTGPHKVWDNTHAHYITHRIHMAESINIVCHVKMKRKNGLNKAYPYRNQAQVQYINLAWINEKGKRMWHKVYNENKTLGSCRCPPFWSNNENELCPRYIFPI
jgi:hypothetical protein